MNPSESDNKFDKKEGSSSARNKQSRQIEERTNTDEPGSSANNVNIESEGEFTHNSMVQNSHEPSGSNLLVRTTANFSIRDQVLPKAFTHPPDQDTIIDIPPAFDIDDSDGSRLVLIYHNDQAPHNSDIDLRYDSNESLTLDGLKTINDSQRLKGLRQNNDTEMNSGSFVSLMGESGSSSLLDQESGNDLHVSSSDSLLIPTPPNEVPHVVPINQENREDKPGVSADAAPLDTIFDRGPPTNDSTDCLLDRCRTAEANYNVKDETHKHAACSCPSTCMCQTPTKCLGDSFCPCRQSNQPTSGAGSSGTCHNLSKIEDKLDQQSKGHTSKNEKVNNGKDQEKYQKQGNYNIPVNILLYDALVKLYSIRSSDNFCECSESSVHSNKWHSYENGDEDEDCNDEYGEKDEKISYFYDDEDDDKDDDEDDDYAVDSENFVEIKRFLLEQYTILRIEMDSQQHNILKIARQQASIIYQMRAINNYILTLIHVLGKMVCKVMGRGEVMTRYMPVGRFLSVFKVINFSFAEFMFKFVNKPEELTQQDYSNLTTLLGIIANVTKTNKGRSLFINHVYARSLIVNLLHALPLFTNYRLELAKKIIIIIFYNLCIAPAGLIALQHQSSILNEIQTYIVSDVNYEKKIMGLKFLDLLTRRVMNKKVFQKIEEFVPRYVLCTDSYDDEYNIIRHLSVKVIRNLLKARDRFRRIEKNMITAFSLDRYDYYHFERCLLANYYQCASDYAAKSTKIMH